MHEVARQNDVNGVTVGRPNGADDEKNRRLNDKSAQTTKLDLLVSILEDTVAQTLCRSVGR